MSKDNLKLHPFLPADKISGVIDKLAKDISSAYSSDVTRGSELVILVTLKGAFFFAADLVRRLEIPVQVDFVRVASYGNELKSTGNLQLLKEWEVSLKDRHVLILDEIVDTGRTLDFLEKKVWACSPRTLKVCALLDKFSRREVDVKVDFIGLAIEDKFVIGYGLDFEDQYRNLPDIYYCE